MKNYVNDLSPLFDSLFFNDKCNSKQLKTDIIENEDSYIFMINVPGFNKENIKISLENGRLTVTASKEEKEDNNYYILKERNNGTFSRSYFVGDDIKIEHISAKLENGVLYLTVQKVKEEKVGEQFINID